MSYTRVTKSHRKNECSICQVVKKEKEIYACLTAAKAATIAAEAIAIVYKCLVMLENP
jgi:hypothetical protein